MNVEWRIDDGPVEYEEAVRAQEERVAAIRAGTAPELVWLLEHPPLYTAGTSARAREHAARARCPIMVTMPSIPPAPGSRPAAVPASTRGRSRE